MRLRLALERDLDEPGGHLLVEIAGEHGQLEKEDGSRRGVFLNGQAHPTSPVPEQRDGGRVAGEQ